MTSACLQIQSKSLTATPCEPKDPTLLDCKIDGFADQTAHSPQEPLPVNRLAGGSRAA
jgi:hypothetical protein